MTDDPVHSLTGSRGTLVGDARGNAPLPAGGPARREMSEGARVQARTRCRMPPHQPAGIAKRAVRSPQRRCHKAVARCVPRFLTEVPPASRARNNTAPLTPAAVARWV